MPSKAVSRRSFLSLLGGAALISAGYMAERKLGWLYLRDAVTFRYIPQKVKLDQLADLEKEGEFDVCIVGSGPAGTILALDLVKAGYRTLILESGLDPESETVDERIDQLEVYQNSGSIDYPYLESRFRGLGGTGNLWTGRCPRLYPLDFEVNAYTPDAARWPVTYDELEPYFTRAETTLRVRGSKLSTYFPPMSQEFPIPITNNISFLKGLGNKAGITIDDPPTSTGLNFLGRGPLHISNDLLPEYSENPRATILTGVTATQVLAGADGAVTGIEIKNLDQESFTVRARLYVLAGGGFENARLLLLSKSSAFPNGLGNNSDWVGRCFMEHPNVILQGIVPDMKPPEDYEIGRSHQFYESFKQEGYGSTILFFQRSPRQPKVLTIGATIEPYSKSENRVTLSPDLNDFFGQPVVNLSYSFFEEEHRTIEKATALVQELYQELGATEVREPEITYAYHPMGTCRMGDDPQTSVTDRNLRVHETPNLYVAGSAVFVTAGASNPTLPIAAFSHRLADHLIGQLQEM